jgi:hypothetical protein
MFYQGSPWGKRVGICGVGLKRNGIGKQWAAKIERSQVRVARAIMAAPQRMPSAVVMAEVGWMSMGLRWAKDVLLVWGRTVQSTKTQAMRTVLMQDMKAGVAAMDRREAVTEEWEVPGWDSEDKDADGQGGEQEVDGTMSEGEEEEKEEEEAAAAALGGGSGMAKRVVAAAQRIFGMGGESREQAKAGGEERDLCEAAQEYVRVGSAARVRRGAEQ